MTGQSRKRVVLKFGTGVLTLGVGQLHEERIGRLCSYIKGWIDAGYQAIVVSSGSVGLGMGVLKLTERPNDMPTLQACAAIGQSDLVDIWKREMGRNGVTIAQVLLTRENLDCKNRYAGVQDTLEKLIACGVVPVINENDTVSTEEIKFGDNDVLSALVAALVGAEKLILLSTIEGLKTNHGEGKLVPAVKEITPEIEALAGDTRSKTAVGGMVSKLQAAKIAINVGCGVNIVDGREPQNLERLLNGEAVGTFFNPVLSEEKDHSEN